MARRKAPRVPDAGAPPEQLLRFDEDEWADDKAAAACLPGGEFSHPGMVHFLRKQRWHKAQQEWSVSNGLHKFHLLHACSARRPDMTGGREREQ